MYVLNLTPESKLVVYKPLGVCQHGFFLNKAPPVLSHLYANFVGVKQK